ncbi:MAG: hypothetical protein ACLRM9_10845 [Collinsella aerofaciens]
MGANPRQRRIAAARAAHAGLPHMSSPCAPGAVGRRTCRARRVRARHHAQNMDARNFRIFAPDETASNRLSPVFGSGRRWVAGRRTRPVSRPGRPRHGLHALGAYVRGLGATCSPAATASTATDLHPHRRLHGRAAPSG